MKYHTIYADPPWPYKGGLVGNGGRGKTDNVNNIIQVGVKNHYNVVSIKNLISMPINQMVEKQAHLYLWTTNAFMEEAHQICKGWGFMPKTILTWVKIRHGDGQPSMKTGWYYRSATEHILFGVRGGLRLSGPCMPTAYMLPRESHSKKPDFFYDLIEQQSLGPYCELFARAVRPGWDSWGNEIVSNPDLSTHLSETYQNAL